ncbi:MAG: hypothetical protein KBC15_00225 [Candidatus Levybacteria bacterium]|nr:hypothetical protein [Candidatus Levybacteria bacterium]
MVAQRRSRFQLPPASMRVALRSLEGLEPDQGDDDLEGKELSCEEIIRRFKACGVYRRTTQSFTNDTALCAFLKRSGAAGLLAEGNTADADQLVKDELKKRK